jgi:uncharacterized phage protein (TIGR02220 family)
MPNRIIREGIISSESVCSLTWPAEVFYRRLLSVVDDFGRYHAHQSLLRAACYPLQIDKVGNADIAKWLAECARAGLVSTYTIDGKEYLQVHKFDQRVRAEKSKFPQMQADDGQLTVIGPTSAHVVGDGDGDDKTSSLSGKPDFVNGKRSQAVEILDFLNAKTGRNYQPVDANLKMIAARLKEGATVDDCRAVIAMKCREWGADEKMEEYLRPATLFNATKFAQYRGKLADANP